MKGSLSVELRETGMLMEYSASKIDSVLREQFKTLVTYAKVFF